MAAVRGEVVVASANLAVVAQALSLSKQDRRFGDPDFLTLVRNGLFQDVRNSGTGQTLNDAYDVITMAEETMLLANLDVELVKTISRESGGTYYNMHNVKDRKTGKPYTIFVDTTKPMLFLKYKDQMIPKTQQPATILKQ